MLHHFTTMGLYLAAIALGLPVWPPLDAKSYDASCGVSTALVSTEVLRPGMSRHEAESAMRITHSSPPLGSSLRGSVFWYRSDMFPGHLVIVNYKFDGDDFRVSSWALRADDPTLPFMHNTS